MRISDIAKCNTSTYSLKENWSEICYLDTGNLTMNRISCLQIINTACDIIPSRARRKVKDSSILFSTVRPDQLHFGIISKPQNNLLVSTGFAVIDVNTTVVNPYYVYIFLTQAGIIAKLQNIAENSTSAYPSITPNDIMELEIDLPSINEQSRIANIFQSIDRKISINATINDNLEQQMHLIFKNMIGNAQSGHIKGENITAKEICSIVTGREDANFSSINGKDKVFSYSQDVLI